MGVTADPQASEAVATVADDVADGLAARAASRVRGRQVRAAGTVRVTVE